MYRLHQVPTLSDESEGSEVHRVQSQLTEPTTFPSGKMAYREWHWDKEEALDDETKLHCGCVPQGMYVLPNSRWEVVSKINV